MRLKKKLARVQKVNCSENFLEQISSFKERPVLLSPEMCFLFWWHYSLNGISRFAWSGRQTWPSTLWTTPYMCWTTTSCFRSLRTDRWAPLYTCPLVIHLGNWGDVQCTIKVHSFSLWEYHLLFCRSVWLWIIINLSVIQW